MVSPLEQSAAQVDREKRLHDLLARCVLRDQLALKLLYDETAPYLNRVAFNILHSEEWSNDALQEAFIQIWKNAERYRPDLSKPLTWMSSIVRYRALDRLTVEKRHGGHIEFDTISDSLSSMDAASLSDTNNSIEDDIEQTDRQKMVVECFATLNERGRRCIQLAYIYGYSREELAESFDTNVNTIKSWLHRNVKRLRTCLEQKSQTTS